MIWRYRINYHRNCRFGAKPTPNLDQIDGKINFPVSPQALNRGKKPGFFKYLGRFGVICEKIVKKIQNRACQLAIDSYVRRPAMRSAGYSQ